MLTRIKNWWHRIWRRKDRVPDLERIFTLAPDGPVYAWECRVWGDGQQEITVRYEQPPSALPMLGKLVDVSILGKESQRCRIWGVDARTNRKGGWDVELTLIPRAEDNIE